MKKTQETPVKESSRKEEVLHLAFELSNSKWKLAFSDAKSMKIKPYQEARIVVDKEKARSRRPASIQRAYKSRLRNDK
jgi:hypothetical protein